MLFVVCPKLQKTVNCFSPQPPGPCITITLGKSMELQKDSLLEKPKQPVSQTNLMTKEEWNSSSVFQASWCRWLILMCSRSTLLITSTTWFLQNNGHLTMSLQLCKVLNHYRSINYVQWDFRAAHCIVPGIWWYWLWYWIRDWMMIRHR